MKKLKMLSLMILSVCMFSFSVLPITAGTESDNEETYNRTVEPRWWPGNPNPPMYSEAWFQQNPSFGTTDPTVARQCAGEALFGSLGSGATNSIGTWLARGVWTVGSFGSFFGGFIFGYGTCVVRHAL